MTTLLRSRLRACACVLALGAAGPLLAVQAASAQETAAPRSFDIPAGPLETALRTYALQSGEQILFDAALVAPLRAPRVAGRLTSNEALERLLAGSGLAVDRPRAGVVTLHPAREPGPSASVAEPASVEAVVVTGSLIRGRSDGASPLVTLDRDALDREGRATVADALSALPQVFNGVATPQTQLLQTDGVGANTAASTGVNLRGLGSASTLVLLNGRRLGGSGLNGDFVDVSAIPAAAVDRIEVLLDGASALYGSDAIGGVVNIRLRTDYTGAETRVRTGGPTGGGGYGTVVGQTFGRAWTGGHLLFSYEYQDQDRLAAADRPYAASADLRPFGGTDHRLIYSFPANILGVDPVSGGYVAAYSVPARSGAGPITAGDLVAGQPNLENYRALGDILPSQQRHSLYLNLAQALNDRVTLSLDALYTHRRFDYNSPESLSVFNVTDANPFFVSPDGASSELVGYAFGRELGPIRSKGDTDQAALTAGTQVRLGGSWRLDASASFAQDDEETYSDHTINSLRLNEALGASPDNPQTAYQATRDGYFDPFGTGDANGPAVLDFIGSGYASLRNLSRVESVDLKLDGDVLDLPGGTLKAAFGGQVRHETFKPSAVSFLSRALPRASGGTTFDRTISAVFAELRVPLVGPANALPGVRSLELSLAGRIENYDDVGLTGNPKLGVVWRPVAALKLRGSWGTSFRAPSLTQVFSLESISPSFIPRGADDVLSLIEVGGNRDLKPETATTWSAGADYTPRSLKGLVASVTGFEIDYTDRIGQPAYEDLSNALSNPDYAAFVTAVSPASNPADLALVQSLIARSTSASVGLFAPTDYGAIIDARYVNASQLTVRGVDVLVSYSTILGPHALNVSADAAYLADYTRRLTAASAPTDLVGQTGQPAALRFKGIAGWGRGPWSADLAVNVTSGSKTPDGGRVSDWTTLDLGLGWRSRATAGPLQGLTVRLNVQNVADADPPFYDSPFGVGYDTANADALGRAVSMQVTRKW